MQVRERRRSQRDVNSLGSESQGRSFSHTHHYGAGHMSARISPATTCRSKQTLGNKRQKSRHIHSSASLESDREVQHGLQANIGASCSMQQSLHEEVGALVLSSAWPDTAHSDEVEYTVYLPGC